ncbi:MAG: asparagine--tRNA ligase [Candidatus Bilamarchaeaceae archaeon]
MGFVHVEQAKKPEQAGKEVKLRGWVYRQRASSEFAFIVMRDATGIMQCTVKKENVPENVWNSSNNVFIESAVEVTGTVKEDKRAPGGYELQVKDLAVAYRGEPYPISKDLSEEFLLDVRHLWLRSQKLVNNMKARYWIEQYLEEFFRKEGFYKLAPPIITKAGCEGGSTLFEMNYFGEPAFLTQSSQMYAEVFIYGLEKVYVFAPSFRAEKSRTIKHLAEYWHLEPEMAWYDQKMNMQLQEDMIKYVLRKMVDERSELLTLCGRKIEELEPALKETYERIDYEEAIKLVNKAGGKMKHGEDFGADEERMLTSERDAPIFITNFPSDMKAFYMAEDPEKPGTAACADVLAPRGHGELIGGSQRIHDYDELIAKMKKFNLDPKDYGWYLDLRKYGSVPHSGFGLGIERLTKWILNLDHIRDAIPFPRTINRNYP